MVSAMVDKLPEEKEWNKILMASIFAKGMLKSKMQGLINRYQDIEMRFHKIKQATSVKTAQDFIERFLDREQNYGELLGQI